MSTRFHAILDYVLGLFLIASVWIFDIPGDSMASAFAVMGGGGILLYSFFTDYELSAWRAIPINAHLVLDIFSGLFLVFAYAASMTVATKWPLVAVGAVQLLMVIATGFKNDEVADAHHAGHIDPASHHPATAPMATPRM